MNGTRIGPLATSHTASQTRTKSMTKAAPGTVPLMPGIAPAWSSSQTASPSGIAVTRPKSVGQSFSQRHCMTKWYTHSQPTPSTATAARITKVSWYTTESGADIGSSGPMMRVTSPPTTASSTSRVWIRPPRVGSTFCLLFNLMSAATRPSFGPRGAGVWPRGAAPLGLLITCPPEPLLYRAECTDPPAEPASHEIVGDLLRRYLKPQERVHAGKVPAQCRGARRVHDARTAAGSAQLEGPLDVEPADRVAPDAGVLEQVGQHAVLGDVGLQAGAVDHEVRGDLDQSGLRLDHADDLALVEAHLLDRARHRAVPARLPALLHLRLPAPPERRVGPAHQLVGRGPVLAFQLAHPRLELAAPDRLRIVEALVGETIGALAPVPRVRPVRARDVGAEQVHDLGGQAVLGPVVHQARQHPGGDDAAAAQHYDQMLGPRGLVDVFVLLVRADHVVVVLVRGAELLQLGQEAQPRVAHGHVHELGPVGEPLRRRRAHHRGQDDEVPATLALAHHPDLALDQHLGPADPLALALEPGEHPSRLRRVVVGPDRLDQHLPQRRERALGHGLGQGVGGEAPAVVRPGRRVRPDPLGLGYLRDPGQVLVGL